MTVGQNFQQEFKNIQDNYFTYLYCSSTLRLLSSNTLQIPRQILSEWYFNLTTFTQLNSHFPFSHPISSVTVPIVPHGGIKKQLHCSSVLQHQFPYPVLSSQKTCFFHTFFSEFIMLSKLVTNFCKINILHTFKFLFKTVTHRDVKEFNYLGHQSDKTNAVLKHRQSQEAILFLHPKQKEDVFLQRRVIFALLLSDMQDQIPGAALSSATVA